jgi:alanine racemase
VTDRVIAEIDLAALRHNYQVIASRAPGSTVIAMIKANAYGHGAVNVARALSAVNIFGVACITEAIVLRQAGIRSAILVMQGAISQNDVQIAIQYQLDLVVHDLTQITLLEKLSSDNKLKIWLKLETGMHRLGIAASQVLTAWQRLQSCSIVAQPICLMTHFAVADEVNSTVTSQQIDCFITMTETFIAPRSLANSAAIFAWPNSHYQYVRPGIALYGISPFPDKTADSFDLHPVMTLKAPVIAIKELNKGDAVGYGQVWRTAKSCRIAVISVGYGDGYPRHAKTGTPVLLNKQRARLVGRVSMDMITVDVSEIDGLEIGDQAILWGGNLPSEEVAIWADTIAYELVTGLTARVGMQEVSI